MTELSRSAADHDLAALQARALRQRQRQVRSGQSTTALITMIIGYARRLRIQPQSLPTRYVLHLLVGPMVPLAILASQLPLASPQVLAPPAAAPLASAADPIVPLAPLSLESEADGETPAPDAAFAEIDALSPGSLSPELLAPQSVPAAIAADSANVRNGPARITTRSQSCLLAHRYRSLPSMRDGIRRAAVTAECFGLPLSC
jgi:hypothetical protein